VLKPLLKNVVYEKIKQVKNITDVDLLNDLSKNGFDVNMSMLNKVLMKLEILGLISVSWVGKDKRRIEVVEHI
jgi:DNA-binding PadR family transcriptional regulator